jgi:hypothetical protein
MEQRAVPVGTEDDVIGALGFRLVDVLVKWYRV